MKLNHFVLVFAFMLSGCGSIDPMTEQFKQILYYQDSTQGNNILANRIFRNNTYYHLEQVNDYFPIRTNEYDYITAKSLLFLRNNLVYMTNCSFDSVIFAHSVKSPWITDKIEGWGVYEIRNDSIYAHIYWDFYTFNRTNLNLIKLVHFCGVIADSNQIINWQLCAPFPNLKEVNKQRVDDLKTPLHLKATKLDYMNAVDPNKIWFKQPPKTK